MSEIEVALAQLFRKKGKSSLTEKEFVFAASLDLRWFTPKEAQKFLDISMENKLLVLDGEKVKPTFDYKGVEIPKGYAPAIELLQSSVKPKGIFLKIVDQISTEKDMPSKEVISAVNLTQDRMNIDVEVAALIVARQYGVDISEYIDQIEEEIGARYRG
ncbi:MAG: DUF2240 family protein [Thermoplasmata archaeon]|nr:DUF2240 family protein [Thermoplasmata archaeon]